MSLYERIIKQTEHSFSGILSCCLATAAKSFLINIALNIFESAFTGTKNLYDVFIHSTSSGESPLVGKSKAAPTYVK